MTTEAKFKHALKEMMAEMPLSDINVTALCRRCGCHRQTFYYHYQDIYDLLAAIVMNEDIPGLAEASTPQALLYGFLTYAKENFEFLQAIYSSAAQDLVDDFFFSKIMSNLFPILEKEKKYRLSKQGYRVVSRRFSRFVADEYAFAFRNPASDAEAFARSMKRFSDLSIKYVLPSLAEAGAHERTTH